MAAADKKTTYSAAEVAALESTIQAQQSQILFGPGRNRQLGAS